MRAWRGRGRLTDARRGQAVGINEVGLAEAQFTSDAVHLGDESRQGIGAGRCVARWLHTGAEVLRKGDGRIVARRQEETVQELRTGSRSPSKSSELEPIVWSARLEKVTVSSRRAGSLTARRRTTNAVMILVVLAMSTGFAASWPQRTWPVLPSAMAQLRAVTNGGPSSGSGGRFFAGSRLAIGGTGVSDCWGRVFPDCFFRRQFGAGLLRLGCRRDRRRDHDRRGNRSSQPRSDYDTGDAVFTRLLSVLTFLGEAPAFEHTTTV